VALNAVQAISAMVAPVVLLTVGGLLANGLWFSYTGAGQAMRDMTRERLEIRRGMVHETRDEALDVDRERLEEIDVQLPILLQRYKITRSALLILYCGVVVLGLSVITIAIAVGQHNEATANVALGLVLAGTVILVTGLGVAAVSVAGSATAIKYAVDRSQRD